MSESIINTGVGTSVINIGPGQSSVEDWVDMAFYGIRQDISTSAVTIDRIIGDETISLPDSYTTRPDDYKNWIWTYNTLVFDWDAETGRLTMEVY